MYITGYGIHPSVLLLVFSPFVIFDSDNPLISCLLCKSKTLWNIFMILGRNVEQDQTMCHVQAWQLCLSYFWCYLPLLCLTVPASVAQLDACRTDDQEVVSSTPVEVGNMFFVEIDHEIFSMVILSLTLIQEGQFSVSGKGICTILVNR